MGLEKFIKKDWEKTERINKPKKSLFENILNIFYVIFVFAGIKLIRGGFVGGAIFGSVGAIIVYGIKELVKKNEKKI